MPARSPRWASARKDSGDDVALSPRTVYGATKAFGEHLARAMSEAPEGPDFVVLRFGWVYGPGRERGWRSAQELIERFAAGERRVEFPDYPERIDWTFIDDASEVLLRATERPLGRFRAFNVVGDRRTIRDAAAYLQQRFPGVETVGAAGTHAGERLGPEQRRAGEARSGLYRASRWSRASTRC